MFLRLTTAALCVQLLAATPTSAQGGPAAPAAVCRLAVTALEGQGLSAEQAHLPAALTDALAASVTDTSGCDVISSADIAAIAGFEAQRELCGAGGDSCLAELGDALGVDRIISGTVVRLGTSITITARLLNIKAGRVEGRVEGTVTDEGAVRPLAVELGRRLFAPASTPEASSSLLSPSETGLSFLTLAGGGVAGLGLVGVAVGAGIAGFSEATLGTPGADTAAKNSALESGQGGLVVAGVSGAVVAVGAGILIVGMVLE